MIESIVGSIIVTVMIASLFLCIYFDDKIWGDPPEPDPWGEHVHVRIIPRGEPPFDQDKA